MPVSAAAQWHFGAFRLDPANACLWRGEDALAVPPKAFAVLQYLITHPHRLVTKAELLDAVWPETAVTDAVLRVAIRTLRKVLDDPAPTPLYIATVPRRGYRFLAPVTLAYVSGTCAPGRPLPWVPSPLLVEREAVLQQLQMALAHVQQGIRQVVLLTGEAGSGKTAVVETFTAQASAQTPLRVAHGQCVESYGPGEAYLPILEALGDLCRGTGGVRLVTLLRQQAPTWAAQMPWLLTAAQQVQLHNELQGATRERMLREGAEILDALTAERPLVLVLEDLHWSDSATADLLALLARRRASARLLVLGTYRPGEVLMHHSPLQALGPDLQRHGLAREIPLPGLSTAAVAAYLAARFPHQQFPAGLAPWLRKRTDGNPLFLVTLVQALLEEGVLQERAGCWTVRGELVRLDGEIPESLRQLLEQQLTRLAPACQRVLEVASVAGVEFAAASVAAGLEAATDAVEEHCDALVRQQLLRPLGVTSWPDGTLATRYAFRHGLYQQAAYARLGEGRRVRLHRLLGEYLEAAYAAQTGEIAAELAEHFARGYDTRRAVHYLHRAAEKASQCYAPWEVVALLSRALTLLNQLPESSERTQYELAIHMTLGPAFIATKGQAALEVAQTYARARMLCQQVPDGPQLPQTLAGLVFFHIGQGDYQTAQEIGTQLLSLAQRFDDPIALLNAHSTLGIIALYLGDLEASCAHLMQGITRADRLEHGPLAVTAPWDMGVMCRIGAAWVLQQQGFPDQARQRSQEALARAQTLASPFNHCNLLLFLACFHLFRREWGLAQLRVEESLHLARSYGFPFYVAIGTIAWGTARAAQQQAEAGVAHIRQGLAAWHTMGTTSLQPWGLAMLAESYGRLGQPEDGLTVLAETPALMATTGEVFYAAEIARLRGELLVQANGQRPDGTTRVSSIAAAETCFQHALDVARRGHARFWELRAATSLGRLWQHQGKRDEARELLAPIYGWFTEGFDTADLQEARALLEELS
jgi:DNA-binding winged helix-turn-helix (wHTH) protein/predicted ATPase